MDFQVIWFPFCDVTVTTPDWIQVCRAGLPGNLVSIFGVTVTSPDWIQVCRAGLSDGIFQVKIGLSFQTCSAGLPDR